MLALLREKLIALIEPLLGQLGYELVDLEYVPGRARGLLRRQIGEERMRNIHFLMDFEGSADAGDIEDAGPHPLGDTAE